MRKLLVLLAITLLPFAAMAGEWHIEGNLLCQDCHLQHASEEGQELPGGPYSYLLLKNTINELCLSCHDGSDPTAPDVQAPVQMYQSTTSGHSAAGFFGTTGIDNAMGHTLGLPLTTPLQAGGALMTLNCASCHAVHGNTNYRNLLYDPANRGDSILVTDGTDLFTLVAPDRPPTMAGSVAAYDADNVGYKQNYSAWCASCHDQLEINATALPPAHFNSHPSDVSMNAFVGEYHADPIHWTSGIGEGFPDIGDGTDYGIPRVPFQAPTSVDFTTSIEPAETNEVFCGSCHIAHGGQYEKALRWPYYEGGNAFLAGCQQCHNK